MKLASCFTRLRGGVLVVLLCSQTVFLLACLLLCLGLVSPQLGRPVLRLAALNLLPQHSACSLLGLAFPGENHSEECFVLGYSPQTGLMGLQGESLGAEDLIFPELAQTERNQPASNSTSNRLVVYEVKPGDVWSSIWTAHGASGAEANLALKAISASNPIASKLRVGEKLNLVISDQPAKRISAVIRFRPDGSSSLVSMNELGQYSHFSLPARATESTRKLSGVINSSFSQSAARAKVPLEVVDDFVDLFGSRVEFRRQIQPGDTFSVEFAERRCERSGEIISSPIILSASLMNSGKLLAAIRYDHEREAGKPAYYDEQGNQLGSYFLRYPLKFTRISSTFSQSRFHPVLKRSRPHNGVDFAAPLGTAVRSVADGVVEVAGYRGEAGNMVRIAHGDRFATAYLHLASIARGLRPGARIARGQVVGAVGATGLATGPHLHFSLYDRGKYVDPLSSALPTMPTNTKPIPKDFLLAALQEINLAHSQMMLASAEVTSEIS